MGDQLCKTWEEELLTAEKNEVQPSLIKAVARVFGWDIFLQGLTLIFLEFGFRCSQPFLLGGLVRFYSQAEDTFSDKNKVYWYSGGLIVISALNVLFSQA